MNKQLSLLIIIVLVSYSTTAPPGASVIKTIDKTSAKTGEKLTITFTLTAADTIEVNNEFIFSAAVDGTKIAATDPKYVLQTALGDTATTFPGEFYFQEPVASYKLYMKNGEGAIAQTGIALEVTGPANNLVTKVEATEPKAGKAISCTFTLASTGLLKEDKLIFSNTTTIVATGDPTITLTEDAKTATLAKEITIADKGTYNLYISRSTGITKQTGVYITVASGSFISMTCVLLFGLFLF